MSLTLLSPDALDSNRASAEPLPYGPMEDEGPSGSSVLSDLTSMFPGLDHEVIVTVLQAHDGRIQSAVEYLMTSGEQVMSGASLPLLHSDFGSFGYSPAQDMVGQFSEDIGGLPEVLPAILCQEDSDPAPLPSPSSGNNVSEGEESAGDDLVPLREDGDDNDPLPTYEEAIGEPLPLVSRSSEEAEEFEILPATTAAVSDSLTEDVSAEPEAVVPSGDKKKREYCVLLCWKHATRHCKVAL